MPATSTAINACGAIIRLDDASGVLRDISGSANEVTLDFKNELGEYKVFGDANMYRLECGRDADIKLKIFYSTASNEGVDILKRWLSLRGQRTFEVVIGGDKYSGEVLYESISIPLKSDEAKPIVVDATLKPFGEIVRSDA